MRSSVGRRLAISATIVALAATASAQERVAPGALDAASVDGLVYATGAQASSHYGAGYEPTHATGKPNVWPRLADTRGAWAPKDQNGKSEWLEVSFPPTEATTIYVFETYAPGAIRKVTDGAGTVLYETSERPPAYDEAQALRIVLAQPTAISQLRISIDGSLVRGWAEIDAVGLGTEAVTPKPAPTPAGGDSGGKAAGVARRFTPKELAARVKLGSLVYPTEAQASTSYGGGYAPSAATGAPTVWPQLKDAQGAWAPRDQDADGEWLEVTFPPTETRWIYVFETLAPGAIREVTDGSGAVLYATTEKPGNYTAAQALLVELPEPRTISKLRITVDGSLVKGWVEIDTVALGTSAPGSGEAPASPPTKGRGEVVGALAFKAQTSLEALTFATGASSDSAATPAHEARFAVGAPDAWPKFDRWELEEKTWRRKRSKQSATLELTFPRTEARTICIFECSFPGGVLSVRDGKGELLYAGEGQPDRKTSTATVLLIELAEPLAIEQLSIEVGTSVDSPSIDAVPGATPERWNAARQAIAKAQQDGKLPKEIRGIRIASDTERYDTTISGVTYYFSGFTVAVAAKYANGWWITEVTAAYLPEDWKDEGSKHYWGYWWVQTGKVQLHEDHLD